MKKTLLVSSIAALSVLAVSSSAFAAKTQTYNCDGQKIKVSFPNQDTAVMLYNDELILLKNKEAASGDRYVGENFQLWSSKAGLNLATISEDDAVNNRISDDKGRDCKLVK